MDEFLLLDGVDFLLLDGSGDFLILGTNPVPPPPPPAPSSSGIGGGGRGARGRGDPFRRSRDEFNRQPQQSHLVIRDDDEIMVVIQRFLDKL